MSEIHDKLLKIQTELKAPKNQYNSFGRYKYRNCEDILEAVKPLLKEYGCSLTITDSVVNKGDRYYIKATAEVVDTETGNNVQVSAFARESEDKKGMDASQITGSASSYARKYALNGLFCINDEQDPDSQKPQTDKPKKTEKKADTITQKEQKALFEYVENGDVTTERAKEILKEFGYDSSSQVQKKDFDKIFEEFTKEATGEKTW